jgi:hypothetical protein
MYSGRAILMGGTNIQTEGTKGEKISLQGAARQTASVPAIRPMCWLLNIFSLICFIKNDDRDCVNVSDNDS